MITTQLFYRSLRQRATLELNDDEVTKILSMLVSGRYVGSEGHISKAVPTVENVIRVPYAKRLRQQLQLWQSQGLFRPAYPVEKPLVAVTTDVQSVIIIFEICEASNEPGLVRLKDTVEALLREEYNIMPASAKTIIATDDRESIDDDWYDW